MEAPASAGTSQSEGDEPCADADSGAPETERDQDTEAAMKTGKSLTATKGKPCRREQTGNRNRSAEPMSQRLRREATSWRL
eukprot:4575883-Alexandrium_andersonii.AAC.1